MRKITGLYLYDRFFYAAKIQVLPLLRKRVGLYLYNLFLYTAKI